MIRAQATCAILSSPPTASKPRSNTSTSLSRSDSRNDYDGTTVFVANLKDHTNEAVVCKAFEEYGDIVSVDIPTITETGHKKGHAIVRFATQGQANDAVDTMTVWEQTEYTVKIHTKRYGGSTRLAAAAPTAPAAVLYANAATAGRPVHALPSSVFANALEDNLGLAGGTRARSTGSSGRQGYDTSRRKARSESSSNST
jgi:RNA recognition motif-containing protein